jgi:hypothetical protein
MKPISGPQPVVAILAWDGAVYLYAESLRFLGWKLRQAGCKVIRFGCERSLDTCTSFNSINKTELEHTGRTSVCERCVAAQVKLVVDESFDVTEYDREALHKAESFLGALRKDLVATHRIAEVLDMQYASFPVCRTAFFDFSITTKLSRESVLDDDALDRFVAGVKDQIKLLHALERFHARYAVTHVMYVNGNYSQNTLARQFFSRFGVSCLSVEPQLTSQSILNRVMIAKDRLLLEPEGLHRKMSIDESTGKFSALDGATILKNFGARIDGGDFNAYTSLNRNSIPNEEFERLTGFLHSYSRVHSFFLSSEDELTPHIYSHDALNGGNLNSMGPFATQIEFTVFLLAEAAKYPEIGFVVRMHPRMAVNKRDHFESEEHIRYKKMLTELDLPENVLVIYGDSKISSYYLIYRSDLVVIAWSTIGLEALLLGTPVISVFPSALMYPLESFSRQPSTWSELETALFQKSDYGVPQDISLLGWMSHAYETQFFTTAAPRGKGALVGKAYRLCYRIFGRIGLYGVIASAVNLFFLRGIRFDEERLLAKHSVKRSFAGLRMHLLNRKLARYRSRHCGMLANYGA